MLEERQARWRPRRARRASRGAACVSATAPARRAASTRHWSRALAGVRRPRSRSCSSRSSFISRSRTLLRCTSVGCAVSTGTTWAVAKECRDSACGSMPAASTRSSARTRLPSGGGSPAMSALAAAPSAVHVLGEVGEVREIAERAHHDHRLLAASVHRACARACRAPRHRRRGGTRSSFAARARRVRTRARLPGPAPCRRATARAGGCRRASGGRVRLSSSRPPLPLSRSWLIIHNARPFDIGASRAQRRIFVWAIDAAVRRLFLWLGVFRRFWRRLWLDQLLFQRRQLGRGVVHVEVERPFARWHEIFREPDERQPHDARDVRECRRCVSGRCRSDCRSAAACCPRTETNTATT